MLASKHVCFVFPESVKSQAHVPLDVFLPNIWVPSHITFVLGLRYFSTFIDEFSRCMYKYRNIRIIWFEYFY